jgi:hypothetical protein
VQFFGFRINPSDVVSKAEESKKSFIAKVEQDGAVEISPALGGSYGTYVDLEGSAKNEANVINKYRSMSMQPECDSAIDDVVNEAIVLDENENAVDVNTDKLEQPDSIKTAITEEFKVIMKLLDFNNEGYDIFRRWYVDGRLYFHKVIDVDDPKQGIKELRYVDPRKIRKMRKPRTKKDDRTGVTVHLKADEFFIFNPKGISANQTQNVKIAPDSIAYVVSGLLDPRTNMVMSYLHKAIKPLNQLRMLEDATIIYRMSRAPERRIFYIDVGNLPKIKAEQYLNEMMTRHKNKLVYDAQTGQIRDDRKFMTMLEDFWLPRREGGRGTEITTLPGGNNLGEMTDVEYFHKKALQAMNVPEGRMASETAFNVGRSSEITRDELKFAKFIARLRNKFTKLFDDLLCTQLILKNIIKSKAEWEELKEGVNYDFRVDNHFDELKNTEIWHERLNLANDVDPFVGKYVSVEWVRKTVLRMTEDDIKEEDKRIKDEMGNEDDQFDVGGPGEKGGVAPHTHDDDDQEQVPINRQQDVEQNTANNNTAAPTKPKPGEKPKKKVNEELD